MKFLRIAAMLSALALPIAANATPVSGFVVHVKDGAFCNWFELANGGGKFALPPGDVINWVSIVSARDSGEPIEFRYDKDITLPCGTGHGTTSGTIENLPIATGIWR